MNDKKGFSRLSDLTSDVEPTSEKDTSHTPIQERGASGINSDHEHASRKLPREDSDYFARESAKAGSGGFFSGIVKLLLAIPWQLYLVGGVAGYFYFQSGIEDREISSFQSEISYYLSRNNNSNSVPSLMPGVLPVDLGARTVDRMLFRIKDDYKPKSAGDVSYVVGFNCSDEVVGSYSDGASGYQKSCDIYVIDVRSHTWSYVGNFTGSEPPKSKKGSGSRTGSHPAQDYLRRAGVM